VELGQRTEVELRVGREVVFGQRTVLLVMESVGREVLSQIGRVVFERKEKLVEETLCQRVVLLVVSDAVVDVVFALVNPVAFQYLDVLLIWKEEVSEVFAQRWPDEMTVVVFTTWTVVLLSLPLPFPFPFSFPFSLPLPLPVSVCFPFPSPFAGVAAGGLGGRFVAAFLRLVVAMNAAAGFWATEAADVELDDLRRGVLVSTELEDIDDFGLDRDDVVL